MPIYEYECTSCAHRFEMKRSFKQSDRDVVCPECGCKTQRVFSSVPIIFKGSGFYVNDYRDSHNPTTESTEKPKEKVTEKVTEKVKAGSPEKKS